MMMTMTSDLPTPEQQMATTRRYRGQQALVNPEVFQEVPINRTLNEALKPVPTLAEIELELRSEGYNPSIADVVAFEQHLKSERNEALLTAGALIAIPEVLYRQALGRPLI
jgi:hypothetical protein